MTHPKPGPVLVPRDQDLKLDGRLLRWTRDGDTFSAQTSRAFAVVFPYRRGYHWEIFSQGEVKHHGQVRSLHSALCHVEGNFVGRGMLDEVADDDEAEDHGEPAQGKGQLMESAAAE